MSGEGSVAIDHQRFGRVEVPAAEVLRFDALPGFPERSRFALLAHDRDSLFGWLVSLDDPSLAFVVTDPWQFHPDYEVALEAQTLQSLGAKSSEDVAVMVLVTLREGCATLNLFAPLLLCASARRGRQLILERSDYSIGQPLPALRPPQTPAPAAGAAPAATPEEQR